MAVRRFVAVPTLLLAVAVVWSAVAVLLINATLLPTNSTVVTMSTTPSAQPKSALNTRPISYGTGESGADLSSD